MFATYDGTIRFPRFHFQKCLFIGKPVKKSWVVWQKPSVCCFLHVLCYNVFVASIFNIQSLENTSKNNFTLLFSLLLVSRHLNWESFGQDGFKGFLSWLKTWDICLLSNDYWQQATTVFPNSLVVGVSCVRYMETYFMLNSFRKLLSLGRKWV